MLVLIQHINGIIKRDIYDQSKLVQHTYVLVCTVGWMNLHFFSDFETYTYLSIRYIFKSSIPKNRQFRPPVRQRFLFQKIIGTLNKYVYLICRKLSYTSKNNCKQLTLKIKCVLYFLFSKNLKTVFDLKDRFIFSFRF